jgi:hypothetical protein
MKKTYATPAVLMTGSVVGETLQEDTGVSESIGGNRKGGAVGFNL